MLENKLLLQDPGKALSELVTARPVEGAEQLSLVLFGYNLFSSMKRCRNPPRAGVKQHVLYTSKYIRSWYV